VSRTSVHAQRTRATVASQYWNRLVHGMPHFCFRSPRSRPSSRRPTLTSAGFGPRTRCALDGSLCIIRGEEHPDARAHHLWLLCHLHEAATQSMSPPIDLTDEERHALIGVLTTEIEASRYPLSPRIVMLKRIRARLRWGGAAGTPWDSSAKQPALTDAPVTICLAHLPCC
jgi:hypothetical protein